MIPAQEETSAEQLLGELLACPKDQRAALLEEERFRSSELLDRLLEECHAALPFNAARGSEIFAAARILGRHFEQETLADLGRELERKHRAFCLGGTVQRLLGDAKGAEDYFGEATYMEVGWPARAFFCRSYGLLRWDLGRLEEAAALFHQAARRFGVEGLLGEQACCRALAGLLALQQMSFKEAGELLQSALPRLNHTHRPWLACEAALGLALSLLEAGVGEAEVVDGVARLVREKALQLYPAIPHEEALVGLHWLEGRVAACLGDPAGAEQLLDSVRRRYLEGRRFPETALATLDLSETLARAGRLPEIELLVQEMAAAFEGQAGLDLALGSLNHLAEEARAGTLDHALWLSMRSALRLLWPHHRGVFFRPVPFA